MCKHRQYRTPQLVCHIVWFQKCYDFSLVVFTKKSRKLRPELWCIASKDKPPEQISSFEKHCVLDLVKRVLSQEPSDSCILYFNVEFHGKYVEEDINRQLVTYECCDN